MKKSSVLIVGVLVVAAVALLLVGRMTSNTETAEKPGGSGEGAATQGGEQNGEEAKDALRVGLVFDIGGLGDKSFNDSAYRGLSKAKEDLGVEIRYIEPGDGTDRESALRQLAAQGYELVIGVGFVFSDDITKLAKQFPNVKFAAVDYNLPQGEDKTPDNLVGLRFREQEGSYLIGTIAGLTTQTKKVGFVGGMKIPLIRKFEAGYEAGVKQVCPDCDVLSAYAGVDPKAFADPTKGKELALTQYARGADIIYHASGKTGDGVFNAAKQEKKLAIGVDSDQYHVAPCCVLTSMIKGVDVAVFDTIRDLNEGKFESGLREFGLAENGVSFVYDDNNRDKLSDEVIAKVNDLRQQIIDGKLSVPVE